MCMLRGFKAFMCGHKGMRYCRPCMQSVPIDDCILACPLNISIYIFFQAKGLGYAMSTTEELKLLKEVAELTGIIFDPVYR